MTTEGRYKRKDIHLDDFSDFSLSAPALKIRRLDAESLPPVMEEEDSEAAPVVSMEELVQPLTSQETENLERALVVFNPVNIHRPYCSPSSLSVALDSRILSGFTRDQFFRSEMTPVEDNEAETGNNTAANSGDGCKAVVPWVSSSHSQRSLGKQMRDFQDEPPDSMEADETGTASMDVEESYGNGDFGQGKHFGGIGGDDGLRQWQQHCLIPELPPNNLTPVTWLR